MATTIESYVKMENHSPGRNAYYNLYLKKVTQGSWWLTYENGKVGAKSTMKTLIPGRTEEYARSEYERHLASKIKGGYEVVEGTAPGHLLKPAVEHDDDDKPLRLQVPTLKELTMEEVGVILARHDPDIAVAEKKDGYFRFMIVDANGGVRCLNKEGQKRKPFISVVAAAARKLIPPDSILNVELMERDNKYVFIHDVQRWAGEDVRDLPRRERHALLQGLPETGEPVSYIPYAKPENSVDYIRVLEMYAYGETSAVEGFVLWNLAATYGANRDRKYKLNKTASVVVMSEEAKPDTGRFVYEVGVYRNGVLSGITTAAPTQGQRYKNGDVLEIRYRTWAGGDGRLQECFVLEKRDDVKPEQCTWDKLIPTTRTKG